MEGEASAYLSDSAAALTGQGLRVQVLTPAGDPARRILETAREMDVGLIAMTTHGRSGMSRVVFGSVAESVVRGAPVPVLLMRASSLGDAAHHAAA